MNKLILIGNGFDLAHGLPTSYKDFLNDFWLNLSKNHKNQELIIISEEFGSFFKYAGKEAFSYDDLILNLKAFCSEYEPYFSIENCTAKYGDKIVFGFKNYFFKIINTKNSIENWVDIENEYYLELKKITKLKFGNYQEEKLQKARKEKAIKLNKKFEEIKNLFEKYLLKEVVEKFDFQRVNNSKEFSKIGDILKPFILSKEPYINEKIKNLSKEFSFLEDEKEIYDYSNEILLRKTFEPVIFKSLILSFNYTPTISYYKYFINRAYGKDICKCNYIHGEINSIQNKINFGFGDEKDNYYKEIENIGDNEYLKNFKSFQYSNTKNYDDLLRYIDSGKYQVYILGHSCGLSDRLLLNTIFEHDNCRSIKVFYYENEKDDNYTAVIQNISRHFDDKKLMRRKILNKQLCQPLPQTTRFNKKL